MDARSLQLAAIGAAAAVAAVLAYKFVDGAKQAAGAVIDTTAGVFTGNNAITENQTNAAGEKTTAYQGAGVLGTVGAATNSVSGGVFASWGEDLGAWFYDATHTDPMATSKPVNTGSVSGGW
ncbi:MAG TPA: hypothetical protein VNU71_14595 [Burkholderiaceae bacterium]|nr:hypothetical protein [Burkholderiaceae bacterium]